MGCESHVHFREWKLPLWVGAGCAVLARRARALAGAWACCALGRKGMGRLLVTGDQQGAWERVQQVLWAHEGPLRTFAGACWVL